MAEISDLTLRFPIVPLDTAAAKTRGGLTSCGVCAGEAETFFG